MSFREDVKSLLQNDYAMKWKCQRPGGPLAAAAWRTAVDTRILIASDDARSPGQILACHVGSEIGSSPRGRRADVSAMEHAARMGITSRPCRGDRIADYRDAPRSCRDLAWARPLNANGPRGSGSRQNAQQPCRATSLSTLSTVVSWREAISRGGHHVAGWFRKP
jgi:hypothetical protein